MSARRKARFELAGWLIFIASALLFTVASARAGDALATAGSLLFLLACFAFVAPLLTPRK